MKIRLLRHALMCCVVTVSCVLTLIGATYAEPSTPPKLHLYSDDPDLVKVIESVFSEDTQLTDKIHHLHNQTPYRHDPKKLSIIESNRKKEEVADIKVKSQKIHFLAINKKYQLLYKARPMSDDWRPITDWIQRDHLKDTLKEILTYITEVRPYLDLPSELEILKQFATRQISSMDERCEHIRDQLLNLSSLSSSLPQRLFLSRCAIPHLKEIVNRKVFNKVIGYIPPAIKSIDSTRPGCSDAHIEVIERAFLIITKAYERAPKELFLSKEDARRYCRPDQISQDKRSYQECKAQVNRSSPCSERGGLLKQLSQHPYYALETEESQAFVQLLEAIKLITKEPARLCDPIKRTP